ncbi:formyltransferase family protein [Alphaproteobacteria bacterium]|nr:formyltransferase family protein [Alphaproteobacteria bacterium]
MKKNKIIFLGYLWPLIEALNSMEEVSLVSVGLEPNRVATDTTRVLCNDAGIQTFDASKIRSNKFLNSLLNNDIDLIVVGAFGQILDKKMLNLPTKGVINFHPSLLPAYKGGSPIEEMLIRGDKNGGVTLHWMSEEVDEGAIIANASLIITNDDDYMALLEKGLKKGVHLLRDIFSIDVEDWPSIDQLPNSKIFSPRKEIDGLIDWSEDASHITRLCNALGWRGWVKTHIRDEEIIIRKSKVVIDDKTNEPGTVIQLDPNLIIRCGINSLEIKEASIPRDLILGDVLFTNKLIS